MMSFQPDDPGTAVAVVSESGKLLSFNPFFLHLTGYDDTDVSLLTLERLLPGFQLPCGKDCPGIMAARLACRNDGFLDVAVDCMHLAGSGVYILAFQDLRTLRQLADLRNQVLKLSESRKGLERFSEAAHDLKIPARKIHLFARQLLEDNGYLLGSEGRDMLERTIRASVRMEKLAESLLYYTRGASFPLYPEPAEPKRLLHEILAELEAGSRERPVIPHVETEPLSAPQSRRYVKPYAAAL